MANATNSRMEIHWTKQTVFPSSFHSIFSSIDGIPVIESPEQLVLEFPDFFHDNLQDNRITLKNLRVGDQLFMPKLQSLLDKSAFRESITIISGEKFYLKGGKNFSDSSEFRALRREFYSKIDFSSSVKDLLEKIEKKFEPDYWAIHLRETDRKKDSLSIKRIIDEILKLNDIGAMRKTQVYIASDEQKRGLELHDKLVELGFRPLYLSELNRNRLSESEGLFSVLDWILLSRATRIVSYGSTTFSYEAAVAGGSFENRIYISDGLIKKIIKSMNKELLNLQLYGKFPYSSLFMRRQKK
jgi:hypothetical protein